MESDILLGKVHTPLSQQLANVKSQCTGCSACVNECAFLQQYGTPARIAELYNNDRVQCMHIAFECSLCGLCNAVCPSKIDIKTMFLELRRDTVLKGEGDLPEHGPLINYERIGMSKRFSWYTIPDHCDTIFFPGCSFSGTRPQLVKKLFRELQVLYPQAGIVLDCCGKPSHDLGRQDSFEKNFDNLLQMIVSQGVKRIIVCCPHCQGIFSFYGEGLETLTIYEVLNLDNKSTTDTKRVSHERSDIVIHDPCGTRFSENIQNSVREIATKKGYTEKPLKHSKARALCCGNGAGVEFVNSETSNEWTTKVHNETKGKLIVSYCSGCLQRLKKKGQCAHILDLYFAEDSSIRKGTKAASGPLTYVNRLLLKRSLKQNALPGFTGERIQQQKITKLPVKLLSFLALLIITLLCIKFTGLSQVIQSSQISTLINRAGWVGPALYIILYTIAPVLFIPALPLSIAGGVLFGPFWGVVYTIIGATLGATAAFILSRYFMREWVQQKLKGPRWRELDQAIDKHGWKIVAVTRLVPLFPYNLLNYAFGVTNVGLLGYMVATLFFMIPGCIAFIVFSSSLPSLIKGHISPPLLIGIVLIGIMSLTPVIYKTVKKKKRPLNPPQGEYKKSQGTASPPIGDLGGEKQCTEDLSEKLDIH